jgi:hypothetical protein
MSADSAIWLGIDFRRKLLQVGYRKYVKLQIWDTAGKIMVFNFHFNEDKSAFLLPLKRHSQEKSGDT